MKNFFFFLTIIFAFLLNIDAQTICLNMIVKNESRVITRCLSSLLPIIDYWVIVDTGSTDGTQEIIKDFMEMHGVQGEVHERPWVDFAHNRNEAITLAQGKGDYLFFIDADEYLSYDPDFALPDLSLDYYYVTILYAGLKYGRIHLVNNHKDWKYEGVLHEVICPPHNCSSAYLEKLTKIVTSEGYRSTDAKKYEKDAQILEVALQKEPNNTRYMFYLAQSYRDAGNYEMSLKNYERRVEMGGWDQEVFFSLLQMGILKEKLKMPADCFLGSYYDAYRFRPTRAEPLYYIANYYRKNGNYEAGYNAAKLALSIPLSEDILFVERWIYDYAIPLEISICSYWLGKYEECEKVSFELLKRNDLPQTVRWYAERNLRLSKSRMMVAK